jgi:hypothetical protein
MIAEGVDRSRERGMMEEGAAAKGTAMPKPPTPGPESVTSDPDRGVAVNSGTDPQRPGEKPTADVTAGGETSPPPDRFDATHQPAPAGRNESIEGGGKGDPDDAL